MFGGERLARIGAFTPEFPDAEALHRGLAHWNHRRLAVAMPDPDWRSELSDDARMKRIEGEFVEQFRDHILPLVAGVPTNADDFVAWFEQLRETGPGQDDPLFDWLKARPASRTCNGS